MLSRNAVKCLLHPTVPWDCGIFHGMSTCPYHSCMCVPLPSHDPMGHSIGCPPVPLTGACVSHGIMGWDEQWDTRICKRDWWTSRGKSHNPMGPWDGMDILLHFWTPMELLREWLIVQLQWARFWLNNFLSVRFTSLADSPTIL